MLDIFELISTSDILTISVSLASLMLAIMALITPYFSKVLSRAKDRLSFIPINDYIWVADSYSQEVVILNLACIIFSIATILLENIVLKVISFGLLVAQFLPLFGMIFFVFKFYNMFSSFVPFDNDVQELTVEKLEDIDNKIGQIVDKVMDQK